MPNTRETSYSSTTKPLQDAGVVSPRYAGTTTEHWPIPSPTKNLPTSMSKPFASTCDIAMTIGPRKKKKAPPTSAALLPSLLIRYPAMNGPNTAPIFAAATTTSIIALLSSRCSLMLCMAPWTRPKSYPKRSPLDAANRAEPRWGLLAASGNIFPSASILNNTTPARQDQSQVSMAPVALGRWSAPPSRKFPPPPLAPKTTVRRSMESS
mmetsp:Transcript_12269/g.34152  ORF Transcript_12269/g.34152 Transcript_12269/m.34152 type:complete len:209 (+) Transcript_12269:1318-1944(+)